MSQPPGPPYPPDPQDQGQPDPWATPPSQPSGSAGYGQPSAYPPQPGYGYPQSPNGPTNGKATASLWTGIGALVLTFCCGLGVFGVVPVVLGVMARSEIRRSGGQQGGEGMALAGIITGAVAVVLSLAVIVVIVFAIASGSGTFSTSSGTGV